MVTVELWGLRTLGFQISGKGNVSHAVSASGDLASGTILCEASDENGKSASKHQSVTVLCMYFKNNFSIPCPLRRSETGSKHSHFVSMFVVVVVVLLLPKRRIGNGRTD